MGSCCATPTCKACGILILVGALNVGLIGLGSFLGFNGDILNGLLGGFPLIENVLYVLIGLAAVMKVVKMCQK